MESLPFIDYILNEDKSQYPFASETVDERTGKPFVDLDNDFRVGNSGGFLMNIDFVFRKTERFNIVARNYEKRSDDLKSKEIVDEIDERLEPNKKQYFYSGALKGTKEYHDFWKRETRRRKQGFTAKCKLYIKDISKYEKCKTEAEREQYLHDVRITGDHYHFLNYGRLNRTADDKEKQKLLDEGDVFVDGLVPGFPRFQDGQYWNYKSTEFAQLNRYNIVKGKARGKGYSYITGNGDANILNMYPKTTVVLLAYEDKFLVDGEEGTAVMLKTAVDWMEHNTYWRRGVAKELTDHLVLGYKPKGSNAISGWRSRALSFPIKNNESAAIGKRARRIRYEESGYCPNLQKSLDVTLSSTEVGMGKIGYIEIYGTAGTKTDNWRPFANAFFNPGANKCMPFENVWDFEARSKTCGFFHCQIWNLQPFIDQYGNSLLQQAYEADKADKKRAEQKKTLADWIVYVGQRANTPSEAFRGGNENLFSSPELDLHAQRIESDSSFHYWRDGMILEEDSKLTFKTNSQLIDSGLRKYAHPYIEEVPFNAKDDLYGCIREFYPPFRDSYGDIPDNLYVILADPVRKDKDNKTLTTKNSLNAFYVVMLPNVVSNSRGDIIVASYVGRPSEMSDANRILLKLCQYYNAKVLVEATVGTIIPDFKRWGAKRFLMRDPSGIIDRNSKQRDNAPFGIQVESGKFADTALIDYKDWVYGRVGVDDDGEQRLRLHNIRDIRLLREMQQFTADGNFDSVSAMRLYPYARMYHLITKKKASTNNTNKSIFQKIGLYGYSHDPYEGHFADKI